MDRKTFQSAGVQRLLDKCIVQHGGSPQNEQNLIVARSIFYLVLKKQEESLLESFKAIMKGETLQPEGFPLWKCKRSDGLEDQYYAATAEDAIESCAYFADGCHESKEQLAEYPDDDNKCYCSGCEQGLTWVAEKI